jgi:DNA-binding MarR family transcriptional regulator
MTAPSDPRPLAVLEPRTFEAAKRASLGQLLLKCARLFNERALSRVRAQAGGGGFRMAHTLLLPHLELEGIRLTELARRIGVTKQAASQLVDELVEMGVLDRVPDPADGRAKLIVFTEAGQRGLMTGLDALAGIEREVAERLGGEAVSDLRAGLAALLEILEAPRGSGSLR